MVYTNNTPSGAFRTFGGMQAQFATESHMDICAEQLGLDPFEIRRINMMRDGRLPTRNKHWIGLDRPGAGRGRKGVRAGKPGRPACAARNAAIWAGGHARAVHAGRTVSQDRR